MGTRRESCGVDMSSGDAVLKGTVSRKVGFVPNASTA